MKVGQAKRQPSWEDTQSIQLLEDIAAAHQTWQIALEQFNNATSEDVIDDAIYLLIAAERRYEGLMRVARRQQLQMDFFGRISVADLASTTGARMSAAVVQTTVTTTLPSDTEAL